MIPLRKEKGIAAAAIGIVSSAILAPDASARDEVRLSAASVSPSGQQVCGPSGSGHCYGIAGTDQFIADGGAARFDITSASAPDFSKGGFTAQTLWLGVESSPSTYKSLGWIEMGWTKGWHGDGLYHHYWALADVDNPDPNKRYLEGLLYFPTGPVGTSHHYQISRWYEGLYKAYIDNTWVYDFYFNSATLWVDVGLEYTHPDASAALQSVRNLEWRCCDLAWHPWGWAGYVNDGACVSYDGRAHWQWATKPTHGANWIGPDLPNEECELD